MASLSTAWKILRDLGPTWVYKRIKFQTQLRLAILGGRLPASDWELDSWDWLCSDTALDGKDFKQYLKSASGFFFAPSHLAKVRHPGEVRRQAERVLAREWPYFSQTWFNVGFPPDWHANVLDGTRVADHVH